MGTLLLVLVLLVLLLLFLLYYMFIGSGKLPRWGPYGAKYRKRLREVIESLDDAYGGAAQEGETGIAETELRPVGKARFGATLVDVVTEGDHLAKGTLIVVLKRRGNRVLVRQVAEQMQRYKVVGRDPKTEQKATATVKAHTESGAVRIASKVLNEISSVVMLENDQPAVTSKSRQP